jgi:hypothetical protein
MKYKAAYLIVIGVVLISLGVLASRQSQIVLAPEVVPPAEVINEPEPAGPAVKPALGSEGTATVGLLQTAVFKEISIMPTKVLEDSRCASDVQCVWAGQVRIETEIVGREAVLHTFTEGSVFSFEGYDISLVKVTPYPVSTRRIGEGDYRFAFKVEKAKAPALGKCYVGGCSSQVCSDREDIITNCLYMEVYACYQGAACERQSDGKCGWTETPALKACVAEKSSL